MSAVINHVNPNPATARYNIYAIIHKALRTLMADTLCKLGRIDAQDEAECTAVVEQFTLLLDFCDDHLHHENEYIHTALEARAPGASRQTSEDHVGHERAIKALRQQLAEFARTNTGKQALAQQLYLDLSYFIAENFEHMVVEETHNFEQLIAAYTEDEVLDIERRIVATKTPAESLFTMRWMIPNISARERAFLLGGMKKGAPPEIFNAVLELAQQLLTQRDYYKLERALA